MLPGFLLARFFLLTRCASPAHLSRMKVRHAPGSSFHKGSSIAVVAACRRALMTTTLATVFAISAHAANIAPEGIAILGVNTGTPTTLGSPFVHAGIETNINDLNLNTSVDTFNNPGPAGDSSYVGIIFPSLRTDRIVNLTLNLAAFFDGGWFGPNNNGPGASGTLNSSHLSEPTLQVTTDGGTVWTTVPHTSNYLSAVPGTVLPVAFGPPSHATAIFTPSTPLTGIGGIRLIGPEGGTASNGFLGVFELAVESAPIPEPVTTFLLFAGTAAILAARRRISSVKPS
jgi:hypothetical protein